MASGPITSWEIDEETASDFIFLGSKITADGDCNHDIPDVQADFRKGRGTRDQIANICWIIEKAREFQKNIYFCFIDYAKAFDCVDYNKLENSERDGNTRTPDLPLEKFVCRSGSNS